MADVNSGLEGVLAAETTISLVDGSAGRLLYRGYEIGDLAAHGTFDSVTALLLDGEWPTREGWAGLFPRELLREAKASQAVASVR